MHGESSLARLKGSKAEGRNGIPPEMKSCVGEMMDVFSTVWKERKSPYFDWRDASLVRIPKKGDFARCDNWRGISLLNVMGTLFTNIIQISLQKVVEDVLHDSQCGFRSGRGCMDMFVCARQLKEKAGEHNTKVYILTSTR